jgi:hypothetical protein
VTLQLSDAVGNIQFTTALQEETLADTTIFVGQLLITGLVLSFTCIVKLQVVVLLAASFAV